MLATETMMTIASPTLASRTMAQPSNTTRDRCQPTVAHRLSRQVVAQFDKLSHRRKPVFSVWSAQIGPGVNPELRT
jgi:hypothetical protein